MSAAALDIRRKDVFDLRSAPRLSSCLVDGYRFMMVVISTSSSSISWLSSSWSSLRSSSSNSSSSLFRLSRNSVLLFLIPSDSVDSSFFDSSTDLRSGIGLEDAAVDADPFLLFFLLDEDEESANEDRGEFEFEDEGEVE